MHYLVLMRLTYILFVYSKIARERAKRWMDLTIKWKC